jgi:type II secretory ATPase GspE/PulE/Tfp pilus assembly ATPase PilB-like protein
MTSKLHELASTLGALDATTPSYATQSVERILSAARDLLASDVHFQPGPDGLEIRFRLNGVLQPVARVSPGSVSDIVTRLKVLAELPTYRTEVPQEGRLRGESNIQMRLATFPTVFGERAVVRFFSGQHGFQDVPQLGLPPDVEEGLLRAIQETSGLVLVAGPAGSGKTTTVYACLRRIVQQSAGGRGIVTLEDPVEMPLSGVAQSQVRPDSGFDMARGLRSLLRQDPDVIAVGEIRDQDTAEIALQAALTGHLVLTTFHAGSSGEAVARLVDMGIEPYSLRSGLLTVICQRLLRALCDCRQPANTVEELCGLDVESACSGVGCPACNNTGYSGRLAVAEILPVRGSSIRAAIIPGADAAEIQEAARSLGMISCREVGQGLVSQGCTSPAEFRRVFGVLS